MEEMRIIERTFSECQQCPTILLANIHASIDINTNLRKMEEIVEIAHHKNVNILIFPELCVTGYLWDSDNPQEVRGQLLQGENSRLESFLKNILQSLHSDEKSLEYVIYDNARLKNNSLYNSIFILNPEKDYRQEELIYDKIYLPKIEQPYFRRGTDKRLTIDTRWGRLGFMVCYDLCFVELARDYAFTDDVDAIITLASWRSEATREYPRLNVKTDFYYGHLWNLMNSSKAAYNQVWSLGVNAVGAHDISGDMFWGGSGIWAPSGLQLLQASNVNEELIIMRNLDIKEQKNKEQDDFNYRIDFERVYQPIEDEGESITYLDRS